jgi:hypothetical protein
VRFPDATTDSVDADDGILDGFGTDGYSLASSNGLVVPTDPPRETQFINLAFDRNILKGFPAAFGFVWTDGGASSRVGLRVFDAQLNEIAGVSFDGVGDSLQTGTTLEDRFIGVVADKPIAFVELSSFHEGERARFEVDHLQYGLIIPEPPTYLMAVTTVVAVLLARRYSCSDG